MAKERARREAVAAVAAADGAPEQSEAPERGEESGEGATSAMADTGAQAIDGAPDRASTLEPPDAGPPAGTPGVDASEADVPEAHSSPLANALGWAVLIAFTVLGAWYRFRVLELKPLHHDEGVNGWFILRILDEYVYKYNPKNYHGPLLYFFNTLAVIVGGRTVAALRFMPAFFGTLVIPAMVLFRRQIGWLGVLMAAAWVAIAPIEVYFSRTAIHEIYNFVFNMSFVGGVFAWAATRKKNYLVLAGVSLSGLFATKETTIITVAAVAPSLLLAMIFGRRPLPFTGQRIVWKLDDAALNEIREVSEHLSTGQPRPSKLWIVRRILRDLWLYLRNIDEPVKDSIRYLRDLVKSERKAFIAAAIGFGIVWLLLFSSLFTNPKGLGSFFAAFFAWGDTGTAGKGHEKPWSYWFTHLLWPYYRPLLMWGSIGLIWGSIRRDRVALFSLSWFVLAVAAYSIIPYKTPWCVLSFSSPLFIGIGLLAQLAWRTLRSGTRIASRLASAGALAVLVALWFPYAMPVPEPIHDMLKPPRMSESDLKSQLRHPTRFFARLFIPWSDSWTINFYEYDVKGHPFIYVQNVREYLDLINDLHGLIETAQFDGDDTKPRILMIDAKNPMRWYLQKTGTQTWHGKLNDKGKALMPDQVDIVCTSAQFTKEVQGLLGDGFRLRRYHERPGRKIDLYVRKSIWDAYELASKQGHARPPSGPFKAKNTSEKLTADMRETWSRRGMN